MLSEAYEYMPKFQPGKSAVRKFASGWPLRAGPILTETQGRLGRPLDNRHYMALITLLDAQLAFGHVPLLDHADFSLLESERIGLIGRNGAGKSSLLKILGGLEKTDDGTLQMQQNLRVAYVCLLYTSPSPRDRTRSRMPSSA